jgi:hypothetical protein
MEGWIKGTHGLKYETRRYAGSLSRREICQRRISSESDPAKIYQRATNMNKTIIVTQSILMRRNSTSSVLRKDKQETAAILE